MSTGGLWRVLVVLCVTEVTSWGVLYYAFPVLAPSIATDTGWALSTVTAAFSAGLVVSAGAGIWVGRLLDRHGPRWVMTAGSVLAVPAVVMVATARTLPWFVAGWLLAGLAQSATLYPPAFAALTRWWGSDRVRALTVLTMVAGLSSTVFAPTAAALLGATDWRGAYLVLAVVLAVVTIPLHLWGLRGAWPEPDPAPPGEDGRADRRTAAQVARSRAFLLVVVMICVGSFVSFAVPVNQVPLLIERGLSTNAAAWALGLSGVGQVLGRLGYSRLAGRTGPRGRAAIVLGLLGASTGLLGALPGPAALLVVVAMATGAARGVMTLLQATALSDRWPTGLYGRLGGLLSAPVMIAIAVGPWAGSALAGLLGGYPPVFAVLAGVAAVAAVLSVGTGVRTGPIRSRTHGPTPGPNGT